jgi:hypothetical protein
MLVRAIRIATAVLLASFLLFAQSQNSSITGTVTDPSGAAVPNAELTLTSLQRNTAAKVTTGADGLFTFPNLEPGSYELKVVAQGFRQAVVRPIPVTINQVVKNDVALEVGSDVQSVTVDATAPQLNFENASHSEGVTPETINQLPLIVAGGPRNSAQFTVLLPGVSTGGGNDAFDARINGGLQSGDEAIMDGVSMQEGFMSQSGMVAMADFRMTPDMVSEFRVLSSTYEPEYGSSAGGQIITVTKSGTSTFHGGGFEYLRNKALNATQFTTNRGPGDQRPKDNEHEFGGFIGGPVIIPKIYKGQGWARTYFFTDIESFRIRGGASRPTLSIPSLQERQGDFTDWPYPIYDPATTRLNPSFNSALGESQSNPKYIRDQFSCNGRLNVICPSRIQNSLALGWFKFLPNPTSPGPLNNYLVPQPVPDSILADANHYLIKIDQYLGSSDHMAATIWRQKTPAKFFSTLPLQLATEDFSDPQNSWVSRMNYDHTFSPTLLNHAAFGYLNRNEGYGSVDYKYANDLPQIGNVPSHAFPPTIRFGNNFQGFGNTRGLNSADITTRPTYVFNDMITWVKGRHTIKFGGEYRSIQGNVHNGGNESGSFNFDPQQTGLPTVPGSGNAIASFLLGAVHDANVDLRSVGASYPRQKAYIWHVGDTWKVTSKLSVNYGVRWDKFTPSREKYDNSSFLDFGPNPGAGGRPGRLAFAGNKWGSASAGRPYPEQDWNGGYGPRIGVAYGLNDKTVIRTGYGIFYTQAFYPGWGGGISQEGLNNQGASVGTTGLGGLDPAFYLDQGFPIDRVKKPPFIDPSFANGQGILYRPKDGNRLSYSQQWNFTIERQIANNFMVSVAYVGNKGTRLPSQLLPINALNPSLLSKRSQLTDEFGPNDTVVDGVPAPYPGWAQQLLSANNCRPSVAQALLPFPQYCDSLTGLNENLGSSTYHSFQLKAEKRYSAGLYTLLSYTHAKLLTSAPGNTQSTAGNWNGQSGVISPFEWKRNKALAPDDVPDTVSAAFVYELPIGKGKKFLNNPGWFNRAFEGWEVTGTFKYSTGTPLYFRSGTCNVPSQFRVACIPGVVPGKSVFAQDLGHYNPNKPLFDPSAFESTSSFNFYYGDGPRVTNFRTFSYKDLDMGLGKRTRITEKVNFLIRAEAFNAFNNHNFTCGGNAGCLAFNTDISSADFGKWNGNVSAPRNIQLVGRIEF